MPRSSHQQVYRDRYIERGFPPQKQASGWLILWQDCALNTSQRMEETEVSSQHNQGDALVEQTLCPQPTIFLTRTQHNMGSRKLMHLFPSTQAPELPADAQLLPVLVLSSHPLISHETLKLRKYQKEGEIKANHVIDTI